MLLRGLWRGPAEREVLLVAVSECVVVRESFGLQERGGRAAKSKGGSKSLDFLKRIEWAHLGLAAAAAPMGANDGKVGGAGGAAGAAPSLPRFLEAVGGGTTGTEFTAIARSAPPALRPLNRGPKAPRFGVALMLQFCTAGQCPTVFGGGKKNVQNLPNLPSPADVASLARKGSRACARQDAAGWITPIARSL